MMWKLSDKKMLIQYLEIQYSCHSSVTFNVTDSSRIEYDWRQRQGHIK